MAIVKINNLGVTDGTLVNADVNASAAIALSKLATDPSNASNLASGTVPTARLGSGTASSSVFLAGDNTWAAAGGGITAASQWRLTTDFTGTAEPIASNWEEVDAPAGYGILGSSITESSGIFSFPSTGYWYIQFLICIYDNTGSNTDNGVESSMYTTTDNSTYAKTATAFTNVGTVNDKNSCRADWIMDVTNTSNDKIKFHANSVDSQTTVLGNTGLNETSLTFIRLGDT
jgi:hypothetical protein